MLLHRRLQCVPRWMMRGGVGFLLLLLVACSGLGVTPAPTPTPPPSPFQLVMYDLKIPAKYLNAPVVGPLPADTLLHVGVTFKVNQQLLNQLGQKKIKLGTPESGNNVANQLGISDDTYQKIKAFLGIQNITVKLSTLHTNLTLDGKASSFAKLLQVNFVIHTLNGHQYFAPDKNPQLPRILAENLLSLTGLTNYGGSPQPFATRQQTKQTNTAHARRSPGDDCQFGNDIPPTFVQKLYGYNQLYSAGIDGTGINIDLVELETINQSDIQNYANCVQYHGQINYKNVDQPPVLGQDQLSTNLEGEATLDIEMLAGLAPGANITVYQSGIPTDNSNVDDFALLNDELLQIINDEGQTPNAASVVSMSFGGAEGVIDPNDISAIDQSIQILTLKNHLTVFVSSGDCGAFGNHTYDPSHPTVSFPASDPYAVAVGGTMPVVDNQNNITGEQAWSDGKDTSKCMNQWGTGGGLSGASIDPSAAFTGFSRPDWQKGDGVDNQHSDGKRQIPDVSALAYALDIYFQGQWGGANGTSAAAPIWAAGQALLNEGVGKQANTFFYGSDTFYQVAQTAASNGSAHPYTDITQGNNLLYQATPGWDYTTGLGTPNLMDFYNVLVSIAKQSS